MVAKFNASQPKTECQQISNMIRGELTQRAQKYHIILDNVTIAELSRQCEVLHQIEIII